MARKEIDLNRYFNEWMKKAKMLNEKREKLIRETMDFYLDILKTILGFGIDTVALANYTVVDSRRKKYEIEDAIIIEEGKPYYVDFRREIKIPLEDEEDLRDALHALFSEIIILRNHDRILLHLARELRKSLSTGGKHVKKLTKRISSRELEEPI